MNFGPNDMHYFVQALEQKTITYPISKADLASQYQDVELKMQFENAQPLGDVIKEFQPDEFVSGTEIMQAYVRWTGVKA
ncbi:MAG: hypothetical protein ACRCY2_09380 [Bombilactobacillus sp.]